MRKISKLQCVLTVISVSFYLASNVITGRQLQLPFGLTSAGGLLIFPVTYILSDVFSEIYGYKWSRFTNWISFAVQAVVMAIFLTTIRFPAPVWYQNTEAFNAVLGNTPRILLGSFSAFILGDWANDIVFEKMKEKHQSELKGFSFRAILSSLVGEVVDSLIFFPIAFAGSTPLNGLLNMMATSVLMKVGYEIIILPITNIVVRKVKKYEDAITE